jgi:single-strand selective monofunctional uracil DNA glycosylase
MKDASRLPAITRRLAADVDRLAFSEPTAFVYNPLVYARESQERYLTLYGGGTKEVLLIGMNPGPFGMAQTGVPFGDVSIVRDWLGIEAPVGQPPRVHPKRPIDGFACGRGEVSGTRLWGWARDRFSTPERFFARFFVWNYCPLCFMELSGRNRTPDKLPASEQAALFAACDDALAALVSELKPRYVLGVGAFAEDRARTALAEFGGTIGRVLHPSPASPAANRGWAAAAEKQLAALGIGLG